MKTKTTTIIAMVLVFAAIGILVSSVAVVNSAFAGVASGTPFKNPGACHQFYNGIGVPHGQGISKFISQLCKQSH